MKEHSVTIAPIIRSNSDTLLSTAVEDAVTVSNKESVEKQGNLPTGIGKHTITAKVTYKDRSEEMVEIPYTIKPDAPSISTSIGTAGTNSVTINNVTPGTTVVVYDMTNPNNPLELGRKDVSGATAGCSTKWCDSFNQCGSKKRYSNRSRSDLQTNSCVRAYPFR
ncbi:cell wall surface anchor family protein [Streptococcus pneumoniae]|nr:cell wall surface anchor family protein [Streptococcus pneumoniae]